MNLVLLGALGPWQIALIIAVVLLMFGGKKIPELMKGLGSGVREFKEGMKGEEKPGETPAENKGQDQAK